MRVLAMFALAACGGSAGTTVVMTARDDVPAYGTVPFPTDAVRDGDHLAAIPGLDALVGRHDDLIATDRKSVV